MNNENLIPGAHKLTVEEQSRGGKASGIARSFKSAFKNKIKEQPELFGEMLDVLTEEALENRNLKALEMLLDLSGETVQRETLALKRKELKLKEKALSPTDNQSKEEPMLYKALTEGEENDV